MGLTLKIIKRDLDNHLGHKVKVIARIGRKRTTEHHGILKDTFPAIFLITLDKEEKLNQISYSYTDILTKDIKINFE